MPRTAGSQANYTGSNLEDFVESWVAKAGYQRVRRTEFIAAKYLEQPIYANQFYLGQSVYATPLKCDFVLFHPEKWPQCLIIEAKWQQSGGSVDEKYMYLVTHIQERYPWDTIIVLAGEGYRPGAETWLRSQVGKRLIAVYNMAQFQTWANRGNL